MNFIEVIGIMSGTSLDGIDLAHCTFSTEENQWTYRINATHTIPYTPYWEDQLANLSEMTSYEFQRIDIEFGVLLGELVSEFKKNNGLRADLIASHGHTAFHNPAKRISKQIGDCSGIWSVTDTPVVTNFRQSDVLLGGQGAPLAPVGDWWLFRDYPVCLNLGGIANITFKTYSENNIEAFDVAPCNLILNKLANKKGKSYDEQGQIARQGAIDNGVLKTLNELPFYTKKGPKSLSKETVYETYLPILENAGPKVEDQLATFTEHLAYQIGKSIKLKAPSSLRNESMLVTGGGAYNDWLMEKIQEHSGIKLRKPANTLIQYKEAMTFAFMGVLRCNNTVNCFQRVTGAKESHVAGDLYGDFTAIRNKLE